MLKILVVFIVVVMFMSIVTGLVPFQCQAANTTARKVFNVGDYGAIANSKNDAGPAIRRAIADAIDSGEPSEVRFASGKYRISAEKGATYALNIAAAKDIILSGTGQKTELIITNPKLGAILVRESSDVVLKNFILDYDPVPFTQGKIIAVSPENGTFDFTIDPNYPALSEPNFFEANEQWGRWGMIFDPVKPIIKPGAPDHIFNSSWSSLGGYNWRVKVRNGEEPKLKKMASGDRYVQLARSVSESAIVCTTSKSCEIRNVTVYASVAAATMMISNEGFTIKKLVVKIRPGSDRLLSTNADGVHCPANRGSILIEDCYFQGMADDGVNIYAPPMLVRQVVSPTKFLVDKVAELRIGDTLQIVKPKTGTILGSSRVVEKAENENGLEITLEDAVAGMTPGKDYREADTVFNLSACGEGYTIRKNKFAVHRGRGLLLRAGKGLVEANTFEAVGSTGIAILNEPDWPEGPIPSNITVRGNTFVGGLSYPDGRAIQVSSVKLGSQIADTREIHNIVFEHNKFTDVPHIAYLAGIVGIQFVNNSIVYRNAKTSSAKSALILLDNCSGFLMDGLKVVDPRPQTTAALQISHSVDTGNAGVVIRNMDTHLGKDAVAVLDQR
jgi:hypothetical protein